MTNKSSKIAVITPYPSTIIKSIDELVWQTVHHTEDFVAEDTGICIPVLRTEIVERNLSDNDRVLLDNLTDQLYKLIPGLSTRELRRIRIHLRDTIDIDPVTVELAERNDPDGLFDMACKYIDGDETHYIFRNKKAATEWLEKAIAAGSSLAVEYLANIEEHFVENDDPREFVAHITASESTLQTLSKALFVMATVADTIIEDQYNIPLQIVFKFLVGTSEYEGILRSFSVTDSGADIYFACNGSATPFTCALKAAFRDIDCKVEEY